MIYVDTSVALAHLLAADRHPAEAMWSEVLVSIRLIEYGLWGRLNARGLAASHGSAARALLGQLALLELTPEVLARALDPFPAPTRTLDGLHLASADFLRGQKQAIEIATYDERMAFVARQMGFAISAFSSPGYSAKGTGRIWQAPTLPIVSGCQTYTSVRDRGI